MNSRVNRSELLPLAVGTVAVTTAAVAAYVKIVRPWFLHWGTSDYEVRRVLPGDALVPKPRLNYTRAITIKAPVEQVWQWVVQIGQNRGGLYSYEWLENLAGANIHNAEYVMPRFQNPEVGDFILLYPNGPAYGIAELSAPYSLVLETVNFDTGKFTESVAHDGVHGSWVFVLERRVDNSTRLIVRARLDYEPTLPSHMLWGMVEPINFVMERKMLQGIRDRAESHRIPDALLDEFVPEYEFRGIESQMIHATPERIMEAFTALKGGDIPLAELLGEIRYAPAKLQGKPDKQPPPESITETMRRFGFVELAREPNQVVIGAIGKFHELVDQQIVSLRDAGEFQRFIHEDYQKLAISLRILEQPDGAGCRVTMEYRTHALSEHSRKQFARYWLAIKPGGGFVTRQLLHAVKHHAEERIPVGKLPAQAPTMREVGGVAPTVRPQPATKPEAIAA